MPDDTIASPVAGPAAGAGERVALPLTAKAVLAFVVLLAYVAAMAGYVLAERSKMLRELAQLDERTAIEEALKRSALSVSNALLGLRTAPADGDVADAARDRTPFALEAVDRALGPWREHMAGVFASHEKARSRLAALLAMPSRSAFLELREAVAELAREIEREAAHEAGLRAGMQIAFREHGDRAILTTLALGLAGLIAFGGAASLFFARLGADLRLLGARARAIVSGFRGEPLEVTRRDEVGALMRDVNHLAADLAERERELAMARERRAHREKMAALGAIARTLSHEIGNPLATISAVVQGAAASAGEAERARWQPPLLLEQARRISGITRQIADFSGPGTDRPEPIDVGSMLRTLCDLFQFDPRLRTARIEAAIETGLPAVVAVPDQLSELLMNLLQPSGDLAPAGPIRVEAAVREGRLAVRVSGIPGGEDAMRRQRARQLAEGMGGRFAESGDTIEAQLPVAALA